MVKELPKNGIPYVCLGDGVRGSLNDLKKNDFVCIQCLKDGGWVLLYGLVDKLIAEYLIAYVNQESGHCMAQSIPLNEIGEIGIWARDACFRLACFVAKHSKIEKFMVG